MTPKVSVLIPVYNRQELIVRSVQSAMGQTHRNLEIVVIDNASTDDTWAAIGRLAADDARVVPVRNETNLGPTRSWIRGLERCTGEYVKILWSDDWLEPTCVEELLAPMVDRLDVGLAFCAAMLHFADRDEPHYYFPERRVFTSDQYLEESLRGHRAPVSPCCSLLRRELAKFLFPIGDSAELNRIAERYGAGPDLLFLMHAAAGSREVAHVPKFLCHFGAGQTSITQNHPKEVMLAYRLTREWFADQLADRPALKAVRRKIAWRRWRKTTVAWALARSTPH